jgi:hypothetical protein
MSIRKVLVRELIHLGYGEKGKMLLRKRDVRLTWYFEKVVYANTHDSILKANASLMDDRCGTLLLQAFYFGSSRSRSLCERIVPLTRLCGRYRDILSLVPSYVDCAGMRFCKGHPWTLLSNH